jgi:preprotein translocase subunit YajC
MLRSSLVATLFAASLVFSVNVLLAEEKQQPRPQTYAGTLTKVEANNLTVTQTGDKGERSETFAVTADTKIRVETEEDVKVKVKKEGEEREVTVPKVIEAKLSDLKTGQRVTVTHSGDKKATQVVAHRAAKPRKGEKN